MGRSQSTTVSSRTCGSCTACCQGWHTANINGHEMFPGRPCHFFNRICTIYNFRPDTCRDYTCAWVDDAYTDFPEWMRPDESGVIMTYRTWEGGRYLEVREAGKTISANVLAWLYEFGARHNLCMNIQINGHWHQHGSPEFGNALRFGG